MQEYCVVVDKYAVTVGTADQVTEAIADELKKRGVEAPYNVASNHRKD